MPGESQQLPSGEADPSVMTTQQLDRGLQSERDYMGAQLAVLIQRLDGIDKATAVFHETLVRVPTEVQLAVGHLKELHDEKFESVATQFKERDTRSERESRDNKVAVDAAFAAQKESAAQEGAANAKAINKSELATNETINKLAELFRTTTDALSDKIDDGKERLNAVESRLIRLEQTARTTTDIHTESRLNTGALVAVIGLAVAIITTVVIVANVLSSR